MDNTKNNQTPPSEDLVKAIVDAINSQNRRGSAFAAKVEGAAGVVHEDIKETQFQFIKGQPEGLRRIAAVMQEPLKERIDYYGIGRRLLLVHEVPIGDFPIYDKDIPEFASVAFAALGGPIRAEYRIRRIQIPTFGLGRIYRFGYEEQQVRLFPIFDRAKERVAISIAIAEDLHIFKLLDVASLVGPNPVLDNLGMITRVTLANAYGVIAGNQLIPASVVMHPDTYKDILKWGSADLDQVTLNVTTETGLIGELFGMKLLVSPKAKKSALYVTTTPTKLGRIPIRKDIEVKIFDNVPRTCFDVLAWEQLGFGIHNTYGVVKVALTAEEVQYSHQKKAEYGNLGKEIGHHMIL